MPPKNGNGYKKNYKRKSKPVTWKALIKHERKNTEVKYNDTVVTANKINSSPSIGADGYYRLADIDQGVTGSFRDGDVINIKSVWLTAQLVNSNTSPPTHLMYRMMIFTWKLDTAPIMSDIFSDVSDNGICQSPINADAFRKIIIHRDVRGFLTQDANLARQFKIYTKMNSKIRFDAGSTTVCANMLYILFLSNKITATDTPLLDGCIRIRFTDS